MSARWMNSLRSSSVMACNSGRAAIADCGFNENCSNFSMSCFSVNEVVLGWIAAVAIFSAVLRWGLLAFTYYDVSGYSGVGSTPYNRCVFKHLEEPYGDRLAYTDLREFVAALDRSGELKRVKAEVDPELEITEITDRVSKSGTRGAGKPGGVAGMKAGG